jgi:hypothetical protein
MGDRFKLPKFHEMISPEISPLAYPKPRTPASRLQFLYGHWPELAACRPMRSTPGIDPLLPMANVGFAVPCGLASVIKCRSLSQFTVGDKVMLNPQ